MKHQDHFPFYAVDPAGRADVYGIETLVRARFIRCQNFATACDNLADAILATLPEGKALETSLACNRASTWPDHCMTAAKMAHEFGLPVETIRFLAVLHLGDLNHE
jgi:hypothetical protein